MGIAGHMRPCMLPCNQTRACLTMMMRTDQTIQAEESLEVNCVWLARFKRCSLLLQIVIKHHVCWACKLRKQHTAMMRPANTWVVYADQPWANEEGYNEATADQIAEDHKAARNWYRSFKRLKSGSELQSVDIDADVDARARPPLSEACHCELSAGRCACGSVHSQGSDSKF